MRIVLSMKRLMLLHRSWIVHLKKVITILSLPVTNNSIIKGTTNKHQPPVQNVNDNNGSIPDLEVLRSQLGIDTLVSNIASLTSIVSNRNRNRNRNKFINQIRAPGGHIQITIMIDTQQQYIKLNIRGEISTLISLLLLL